MRSILIVCLILSCSASALGNQETLKLLDVTHLNFKGRTVERWVLDDGQKIERFNTFREVKWGYTLRYSSQDGDFTDQEDIRLALVSLDYCEELKSKLQATEFVDDINLKAVRASVLEDGLYASWGTLKVKCTVTFVISET